MKTAIYPGSFDPLTNGHVDIIERSLKLFDHVIVSILHNSAKSTLFSLDERISLIKEVFKGNSRLSVETFDGLLVNFAKSKQIFSVMRGLRAASDFEYEFQLAAMNRRLCPDLETVFLMTGKDTFFLSSRLVKEVALLGGEVSSMVPKVVEIALKNKSGKNK